MLPDENCTTLLRWLIDIKTDIIINSLTQHLHKSTASRL